MMVGKNLLHKSLNKKCLKVAIDGLDGSGKGSCVEEMANNLSKKGFAVLLCDYPNYSLPWGSFLYHLLNEDDEDLEIKEKMLVYALNRLETVPSIIDVSNKLIDENGSVVVIFDRYVTSNMLTLSYYQLYRGAGEDPDTLLDEYLPFMWQIDKYFVQYLELEETKVIVPILDAKETMKRIKTDGTRSQADFYEKTDVQDMARMLYIKASEIEHRIKTFSQYDENEDRYLTIEENAKKCLEIFDISDIENIVPNKKPGKIERLTADESVVDVSILRKLLDEFGSTRLKGFDPHKS